MNNGMSKSRNLALLQRTSFSHTSFLYRKKRARIYRTRYHFLQFRHQDTAAIQNDMSTIHMPTRPRAEVHQRTRDVLRGTQSLVGVGLGQLLHATAQLHESVGHLGREEAGRDAVDEDALRSELDGQVASQVQGRGLGGGVGESRVRADGADADACDGGGDDDAGGILEGGLFAEEGGESENTTTLVSLSTTTESKVPCRVDWIGGGGRRGRKERTSAHRQKHSAHSNASPSRRPTPDVHRTKRPT